MQVGVAGKPWTVPWPADYKLAICRASVQEGPDLYILKWSMALSLQRAAAQCLGHISCLPSPCSVPFAQIVAAGKEVKFALDIDTASGQSDVT